MKHAALLLSTSTRALCCPLWHAPGSPLSSAPQHSEQGQREPLAPWPFPPAARVEHALAFVMGLHARLGSFSRMAGLAGGMVM